MGRPRTSPNQWGKSVKKVLGVMKIIKNAPGLSQTVILNMTDISAATLSRALKLLEDEDIVKRVNNNYFYKGV